MATRTVAPQDLVTLGTGILAAVGVPPGNADICQPPPSTHSSSGCATANAPITSRYSVAVEYAARSHRSMSRPPHTGCAWAS